MKIVFQLLLALCAVQATQVWAQGPSIWASRDSMGFNESCLDAWDGAVLGAEVVAAPCWNGPNQQFVVNRFKWMPSSLHYERAAFAIGTLCAVPNAAGNRLVLDKCSARSIGWEVRQGMPNRLFFNDKCLDINLSEGNDSRRPVGTWDCKEGAQNQQWGWKGGILWTELPAQWK